MSLPLFFRGALGAVLAAAFCAAGASAAELPFRNAVVKIYVTIQRPDYAAPWQGGDIAAATGSGFVIPGKRILTNAHIVSDAKFIEVQKSDNPRRFLARRDFTGHDCDLATLRVDDPAFFEDTEAVEFVKELPDLNDEVLVIGYPMGGTRLSLTRGVVSRIDYSPYAHSGVDQHLVLQVDAAINPGNSGGPVLFAGRVVGLAFQALHWGENIGYAIPVPVIEHFLADIADGQYHGYPELGVAFIEARNPAMRKALALPPERTGIVVHYVDPYGSALGILKGGDVLCSIDEHVIADDGSVTLDGTPVLFAELLERKQWGESIAFRVWREGRETQLDVPLRNPVDPFVFRHLYDRQPEYLAVGGLVFSPLNRELLRSLGGGDGSHSLLYYSAFAKLDGHHEGRAEFVVLIRRLPHPVNTYAEPFVRGIVTEANGKPIGQLKDLRDALREPGDGFHVLRFADMEDALVLDAAAAQAAQLEIMRNYGMTLPHHLHRR